MTKKAMRLLLGLLTALALSLPGLAAAHSAPVLPQDPPPPIVLDLYNLTDVHGHIEQVKHYKTKKVTEAGVAAVGCFLDSARKENPNSSFTLLGDNIGASPFTSGVLYDNPTIAALNKLQPIASTLGNHELDLGQDVFKARINGTKAKVNDEEVLFEKVGFPYLAANVEGLGNTTSGDPYLGKYVIWASPSGIKVAFIGAIAQDVPYKLSPGTTEGMTFKDPIPILNDTAKELKESGKADIVIAMLDDDVKNNYPKMGANIDGLMGGDTHVPYSFSWVDGAENNKLSATASGSYTDNLSWIKLLVDPTTKKVISSEVKLIPAEEIAKCTDDPYGIKPIVAKAVTDSKAAGEKVVATGIFSSFYRAVYETSEGPKGSGSNRGHESSLGDLVADSIKDTVNTLDGKPVDLAFINAGGLREDLIPNQDGTITYAQTYAVEPFSNELGYVTITGKDVKDALEQQWKTNLNSQNSRPMLKLGVSSNVTYTYDPAAPFGSRITSVLIDGVPLDPAKKYTVGSVTFLLAGGDSFDALTRGGAPVTAGNLDRDMFNKYLGAHSGVKPRMAKSSVGVTLPSGPVAEGEVVNIALRGLAFTEGPARNVTSTVVGLGAHRSAPLKVDLSLVDDNASDEKLAVITTDGAGKANAAIPTDEVCKGHAGELLRLPLTISNFFDKEEVVVVSANQGLFVDVQCKDAPKDPVKPVTPVKPKLPSTGV